MNSLAIQSKTSGNHKYYKVTGDDSELRKVAARVNEPVKPQEGYNPSHVDVPARKFSWIAALLVVFLALLLMACILASIPIG